MPPPSVPPSLPVWRRALTLAAPVAMGYYPAGIAYGVLMSAAGLPLWLALVMSILVYSGAAQYAAITQLSPFAGLTTLTVNTAVINLRHIFYAIPLLPALPKRGWRRGYALFALTDESFSLLTTLPESERAALILPVVALNHLFWVSATLIGALAGAGLAELIPHLDFALTCLFLILVYEQWRVARRFWPCWLALGAFVLARTLMPQYVLMGAVSFCAGFILLKTRLYRQGRV